MGERSDFNDLHLLEGLPVVKQQLEAARLALPRAGDGAECLPPGGPEPRQRVLDPAMEWQEYLIRNQNGTLKSDIANLELVIRNDWRWAGVLGYCDFSYRIIKRKAPPFEGGFVGEWNDADTARLRIWMSRNYGFTPKDADALNGVLVASQFNRFHPVCEYLNGLVWDGKFRLWNWLQHYLGAEGEGDLAHYHGLVGTMWLLGGVARVMQPPVKVDNVLIFEGVQGLGKSTALSILAGEWFSDSPISIGDKDGYQQMQGVWLIELAELDSWHKAESKRNKQFFTSKIDRYRPSYGKQAQDFPRQTFFAGSTNDDAYFKDSTGNRRYWPVRCTELRAEALAADRDQLWAEAVHLYRQGHRWHPGNEDLHLFAQEQELRFDKDVWEEIIENFLVRRTTREVTMSEIMEDALGMNAKDMKPPEQKRVGLIMSHLGWSKHRPRLGGDRVTAYKPPPDWDRVRVAADEEAEDIPGL